MSAAGLQRHSKAAFARRGFTLVEVLVVLAIMVILFSLLFAPMVSGIDLVRRGQRHVTMQNSVRMALERMRRELAEAVYVFEPEIYQVVNQYDAASGTVQTLSAPMRVVNYSKLTFVPAARDARGRLIVPPRPRPYDSDGDGTPDSFLAVRYVVHRPDPAGAYDETNAFVLYRQEGWCVRDPVTGQYTWMGMVSENALSPKLGADIPPRLTICTACGTMIDGYVHECPNCGATEESGSLEYIFEGVQFVPERIAGEKLRTSGDGTLYRARWGGWLGFQNDGTIVFPAAGLPLSYSEIDPRIVVYRRVGNAWQVWLDTYQNLPTGQELSMTWHSGSGCVRFGRWQANGPTFNVTADPGLSFYPLTIGADSYTSSGAISAGAYTEDIYPIYPPLPMEAGDPRAPVGYVIEPTRNGADPPAKILPDRVKVRLLVRFQGGGYQFYEMVPTDNYDQEKIGKWQYCVVPLQDGRSAKVLFNMYDPPSPDWFGGAAALQGFAIEIRYYMRRNFGQDASGADVDDVVVVDYSTRNIINIDLTLSAFRELEAAAPGAANRVVPSGERIHRIHGRDRVVIGNALP